MLCSLNVLKNEASVEQFFVSKLLAELGYLDENIIPKASIDEVKVPRGRKKENFKPDYILTIENKPRIVIDAKAVGENIDNYVGQCASYCLMLNQKYGKENPVRYFILTNGIDTKIYNWDDENPVMHLLFDDFNLDSQKFQDLRTILSLENYENAMNLEDQIVPENKEFKLKRRAAEDMNNDFAWCHQHIYKKDNLSQSSAFIEFVKLIFLKIISDRNIHTKYLPSKDSGEITVNADDVDFSIKWIEAKERDIPNPINTIQFKNLTSTLETEIVERKRKRIFDRNEDINLSAETIKGVVERLQHYDLFNVDTDLNGRLFEIFLNATMRGKDLGQYFTPRSIAKLGVRLANVQAKPDNCEIVLDACCGTGGFLIEILQNMWKQIDNNSYLTARQKEELKNKVVEESLIGIDIAKDPPLARIARMNMYLHGDGGTRIYQADSLDPNFSVIDTDSPEIKREKTELRKIFGGPQGVVDVVITNPPFAKEYQAKYPTERKILENYELAERIVTDQIDDEDDSTKASLRSSLMFIERYEDMLKPGGRMIAVIDDSILGSRKYADVRNYIRDKFIIRAVVSLPGDAFQRSKARVKTSLIYLEKKMGQSEKQPNVFMYYCKYVGIDDPSRTRVLPVDRQNRIFADKEIDDIWKHFESFRVGGSQEYSVAPSKVTDRLDVKFCLPDIERAEKKWEEEARVVGKIGDWVEPVDYSKESNIERIIRTSENDNEYDVLRVTYKGKVESTGKVRAADLKYRYLYKVKVGDLLISNINAVNGAIGVVDEEHDGAVVSNEFTICRASKSIDTKLIQFILRTPELRSSILLSSSGIGRHRFDWNSLKDLTFPIPDQKFRDEFQRNLEVSRDLERRLAKLNSSMQEDVERTLGLSSEEANSLLTAFKPPK